SSARSFAGSNQQALRIAADARAALQHYPSASPNEQTLLLDKIVDSYSDLAFGTFCHADALPRSIWTQLCQGADDVVNEAKVLVGNLGRRADQRKNELIAMAAHVHFVESIGREIRAQHDLPLAPGVSRVLNQVWDVGSKSQRESESMLYGKLSASDSVLTHTDRVERLARLYRRELTVVKQWEVLYRHGRSVSCSVMLNDIAEIDGWYAPWYVTRADGRLLPVNVEGKELDEVAKWDRLIDVPGLPTYPIPLRHDQIPQGMRAKVIANLRDLLQRQQQVTVCVLAYDLKINGGIMRLVLDGNHRLAAARQLTAEGRGQSLSEQGNKVVRVLTFLIAEVDPIDDETSESKEFPDWKWRGFTPDIGLLRGRGPCRAN
ncbi:MAG: hypothetical protein ACRDSH_13625, partial [Pseudonocardiaceae bacterium]